jgi:seryl-tRNA(Sec) selenium transferase
MPLSRQTLERQMQAAKDALSAWVQTLNAAGKERAQFRKDPRWRQLNADVNAIRRRLDRVAEIEANNAEVAQRKAEKQAAAG